jgi:hypothetical protein
MIFWLYRDIEERARGGPIPAWLVYAIGIVALVNFISFAIIADYLGGDAVNGHQAAGHYFLAYHERLTEVSRAVFEYSWWHVMSLFVTHPLAMLVGWLAMRKRKPPLPESE